MDIIKNNQLIAEFIGFKFFPDSKDGFGKLKPHWSIPSSTPHNYIYDWDFIDDINKYKFHKSWDWLMPVVEKIEHTDETGYYLNRININSHYIRYRPTGKPRDIIAGCYLDSIEKIKFTTKLEAVYYICVKAIKYLNKTQTNENSKTS